jgi:hypothetical protein
MSSGSRASLSVGAAMTTMSSEIKTSEKKLKNEKNEKYFKALIFTFETQQEHQMKL